MLQLLSRIRRRFGHADPDYDLAAHYFSQGYKAAQLAAAREGSLAPFSDRPLAFKPDVEVSEDPVLSDRPDDRDGPGDV